MAVADVELKKAFAEMQINKIETSKKVKMIDMQCDVLKTSKQKYAITDSEVKRLDPDTKVYSSIGRMFALMPVPVLREELKHKQEKCASVLDQLETKKKQLKENLKEQEDSLRELVQQKKEVVSK